MYIIKNQTIGQFLLGFDRKKAEYIWTPDEDKAGTIPNYENAKTTINMMRTLVEGSLAIMVKKEKRKEGMKIKLTIDLPLAQSHGMVEGAEFETIPSQDTLETTAEGLWVRSLAGVPVKVLHDEYEPVRMTERLNS